MTSWWVLRVWESGGPALLFAWAIWVIAAITLHELAHGWAAVSRGDNTPIESGHMTLNPLVHMGGMSLIVFALTGIAWGMMPVDPSRFRGRHADAWVAFAGPLMNIVLAAVCIIASAITIAATGAKGTGVNSTPASILLFFAVGCSLNIFLALFNMLPAPPLDGSRVLASFSRQYREAMGTAGGQFGGAVLFIIAFFFAGRFIGGWGMTVWGEGTGLLVQGLAAAGLVNRP